MPFKFQDNNNIIEEIFDKYNGIYTHTEYKVLYQKFRSYFIDNWEIHIKNGALNYIYLNKKERSNSYIENYNRRIKDQLKPFLSKRGRSIVSWPIFLMFIINEENYFNLLITDKLKDYQKINLLKLKK